MGNKHGKSKKNKKIEKKELGETYTEILFDEINPDKLTSDRNKLCNCKYHCLSSVGRIEQETEQQPKVTLDLTDIEKDTIIKILELAKNKSMMDQMGHSVIEIEKVNELIEIFKSGKENISALLMNCEKENHELCRNECCEHSNIEFKLSKEENNLNSSKNKSTETIVTNDNQPGRIPNEISVVSIQSIESLGNNDVSVLSVTFTQSEKTLNQENDEDTKKDQMNKIDSKSSLSKSNIMFFLPKKSKENLEKNDESKKMEILSKLSLSCSKNFTSIIDNYNSFGLNLFQHLFHEKKKSVFFSPYNVAQGLSLCYIGAQSQTREQIDKLLNFRQSNEDVGRANACLKKCLKKPGIKESGKLVTLNQIYVHNVENNQKFNQVFLDLVDKYYKSGIEFLNFDNKNESLYKINLWIGQKTKDKLKYLAEECDLNPKGMILINATYFCGKWKNSFDVRNTKTNLEFRLSDGNIERVDMMCQYNVEYNYNENFPDLNASICELPYEGNLSLIIILPHDGISIALVESKLTICNLANIDKTLTKNQINVSIPIFKLHIKTELSGDLIKMGAENLFLKNKSNFGTVFEDENGNEHSHLTKVIHKAILRVNETGIIGPENKQSEKRLFNRNSSFDCDENSLNNTIASKNFICNRPFIFLIRDYQTNLILFIGKYERRQ